MRNNGPLVSARTTFFLKTALCAAMFFFVSAHASSAATITWTGGGADGNWSTPANWSGNVVPGAADSVILSASSTKASIWDAAGPAQITGITVTSLYTGTLTMGRNVAVSSGGWSWAGKTFVAGGFTIQFVGANVLTSLIPGTASYANIEDAQTGSSEIFVSATTTLTGNLVISAGPLAHIDGRQFSVSGNVVVSSTDFQTALSTLSTASILITGVGTQTISSNGGWLPAIIVNKSGGSLTATSPTLPIAVGWTLTAGTLNIGTSVMQIVGSSTVNVSPGTATYWNVEDDQTGFGFFGVNGHTMTVNNLVVNAGPGNTFNAGVTPTFNVKADYITSSTNFATSFNDAGNGVVVLNGTSTQNIISNGGYLEGVTINKSSGVVNLASPVITITGDWTFSSGTLNAGTSTLVIKGSNVIRNIVPGSATYYNIQLGSTNATKYAFSATTTIANSLILTGGSSNQLNASGSLLVGGNVTVSSTDFGSANGGFGNAGSAIIVLNGTSTQNISSLGGWLPNVTISKSSGTVNLTTPTVLVAGNWLVLGSSVLNAGTSNLQLVGNQVSGTFTPGNGSYYDLEYARIGNSVLTLTAHVTVTRNLVLSGGSMAGINSAFSINDTPNGEIDVGGNYIVSSTDYDTAGVNSSLVLIVLDGTGNQEISSLGGLGSFLSILKSSGIAYVDTSFDVAFNVEVLAGELRLGSSTNATTFTVGNALAVDAPGILSDVATVSSTLLVQTSVLNNGEILFEGGRPCATSSNIFIDQAAGFGGSQVPWDGSGSFYMRYVNVANQAGSAPIVVLNGTNLTNNGANWSFVANDPVISLLQSKQTALSGVTSATTTFTLTPRPTDLVIVAVSARGQSVTSVTDNQGNTYSRIAGLSSNGDTLALYYARGIQSPGGAFTITASAGGPANFLSIGAFDYMGAAATTTLDAFTTNTDAAGSVNLTSGNMTAASANELYFGAATVAKAGADASSGAGWTSRLAQANNISLQSLYAEDRNSLNPLTVSAAWTDVTSTPYMAIGAMFKPPVATGFPPSGSVDSSPVDTKVTGGVQINSILWQGNQPAGTSVGFQLAVSNSASGPWTFKGPDGTSGTYFTGVAGTPISLYATNGGYALFNGFRYFEYRVTLFTDPAGDATPTVNQISINISP